MKHVIPFFILTLFPVIAAAQPAANADLALRARAILRKHCGDCHGLGPAQLGDLSIAARSEMDRPARPFLRPGNPNASQLIDLIEAGNMPPGTRPKVPPDERMFLRDWISADAPGYPKQFNDEYVIDTLMADLPGRPAADRPFQRYLSLAHIVTPDTLTLQPQRDGLLKALRDLSKSDAALEPVDPTGTVYRLDLRRLGWDVQPFDANEFTKDGKGGADEEKPHKSNLNLFDVVLLEYPFGQIHAKAATAVKIFAAVRPVPFVRGDWLAEEFPKLTVAKEVKPKITGTDHLWPLPARRENVGPIPPWDAVTRPDHTSDPAPFTITFESIDPKTGDQKTTFTVGDRVALIVKANKPIHIEVILGDESGETDVLAMQSVDQNAPARIGPGGETGYPLPVPGKGTFVLFASTTPFPKVVRHRDSRLAAWMAAKNAAKKANQPAPTMTGEWLIDRLVHPAWTADGPVKDFDPNQIIKRTIKFEVKK